MLKFKNGDNLFFTSDLHINHSNICYTTSTWENKEEATRRFGSINEMNENIFDNINKMVKAEDHLFILGDILFRYKSPEDYERVFDRIVCTNLYVVFGNHDNRGSLNRLSHDSYYKLKFLGNYLEIEVGGKLLCMSHYPFTFWHDNHKESWNLFGHIHGNYTSEKKQLDVGVDSSFKIFGEYRPFRHEEIREIMNNKVETKHHGRIT